MLPQWHKSPPQAGWYYLAESIKDWDICDCVGVISHTYPDGLVTMWAKYKQSDYDVESELFKEKIWWGPLPNRVKPTEEDIARLSEPDG